ncbi:MAG: chemotaxis protein CheW [Xanthobacteraceae bacterium]
MNRDALHVEPESLGRRAPPGENEAHCFIVYVGSEAFGLPVDSVQTIFQIEAVTPVPLGPREIVGLVNLRGKIVTAVSLRRRLQMPDAQPAKSALAIGMEYRGENFALIVDEVGDVIFVSSQMQIPLPPHLDQHRAKLTEAVYRLDQGVLSMLDVGGLFDFQRRI